MLSLNNTLLLMPISFLNGVFMRRVSINCGGIGVRAQLPAGPEESFHVVPWYLEL